MPVVQLSSQIYICIQMDIKNRFGQKVKELRILKGISQESLANLAEIDRTYISDIEKGDRNVSITIVEKLAIALNEDICVLFSYEK